MSDHIDNNPADTVPVPDWFAAIEAKVYGLHLAPITELVDTVVHLIRHYRELLVVLHDLRQDAGPLYVVVCRPCFDSDPHPIMGVFRSRAEAVRVAQELALDPGEFVEDYRVEEWDGRKGRTVATFRVPDPDGDDAEEVDEDEQDDDSECYQCGGEGTVEVGPDHTEIECPRCNGSGEERE